MKLTVYYDYLCPYVYRASDWLLRLQALADDPPDIEWRFFSLAQVNHRIRDGWTIWSQPSNEPGWEREEYARGLLYFWAAEAAARQGHSAFLRFHSTLLHALHAVHAEIDSRQDLTGVAQDAGLDTDQFRKDLRDLSCLERLRRDHGSGVDFNVFGTPTLLFAGAAPAYLKLARTLDDRECLECWESVAMVVDRQPYVVEVKRPQ